jgi:LysM repeat protein
VSVRLAIPFVLALLLPGCLATTKQMAAVETDLTRQKAWTDERVVRLEDEVEALRAENEALHERLNVVDDGLARLEEEIRSLGLEVSERLNQLNQRGEAVDVELQRTREQASAAVSAREEDRQRMLERMDAVLEEVLRENTRLSERLARLESSAYTFGRMHRVEAGESVASIAQRYGVTPEAIAEANDLPDANLINVGQELLIPGVSD